METIGKKSAGVSLGYHMLCSRCPATRDRLSILCVWYGITEAAVENIWWSWPGAPRAPLESFRGICKADKIILVCMGFPRNNKWWGRSWSALNPLNWVPFARSFMKLWSQIPQSLSMGDTGFAVDRTCRRGVGTQDKQRLHQPGSLSRSPNVCTGDFQVHDKCARALQVSSDLEWQYHGNNWL